MNKKQFKKMYSAARFMLSSASWVHVKDHNCNKSSEEARDTGLDFVFDALPSSVSYAIHGRYTHNPYNLKNNRWAAKFNSTAFPRYHVKGRVMVTEK